jgi:hypothetical protein
MTDSQHEEPGADASVREIERDIERTREDLGETIDALAAKLDVKSHVKDSAHQAKANVVGSAEQAAGAARQSWPEIAVVVVTAVTAVVLWRRLS